MDDFYGFSGSDLNPIVQHLEVTCGLKFVEHDSSFQGGNYFLGTLNGAGDYQLVRNYLEEDDEFVEEAFPECFAILCASDKIETLNNLRERICSPEVGGKFLARR